MTGHCNHASYERGSMEDVSLDHLHNLKTARTMGLVKPRPCREASDECNWFLSRWPAINASDLEVDDAYRTHRGALMYKGDVVLMGDMSNLCAGRILLHYRIRLREGYEDHTALHLFPLCSIDASARAAHFEVRDGVIVVPTSSIGLAVIHRYRSEVCTTIVPRIFR